MSRKTKHLKLHLPDANEYYDVEQDQNQNFEIIDEVLTPATKSEIENILNQNLIKDVLELATEQDIRNLFTGTKLEGGTEYKLSALSTDESKIVNMRLLSLFNDLILQKLGNDNNSLKSELTSLINSIKATLQNAIDLKANKTTAVTGDGALTGGGDLSANRIINHKTSTGFKHIPSGGAINQFLKWNSDGTAAWSAIAWEVITGKKSIIAGTGLKGGGTLENNVTLSLDYGTAEEIKNILK